MNHCEPLASLAARSAAFARALAAYQPPPPNFCPFGYAGGWS